MANLRPQGRLIASVGLDGAGERAQISRLAARRRQAGVAVATSGSP
ncbi:hypothetical protein KKF91_06225 [Myxococcota bacterium]|nr:hypothetical protein [Myxococcota bacterium]